VESKGGGLEGGGEVGVEISASVYNSELRILSLDPRERVPASRTADPLRELTGARRRAFASQVCSCGIARSRPRYHHKKACRWSA